jgi:WD40 repeat protein
MIGANISLGNSVALSSVGDILAIGSHNSLVRVFDLSALLSVDLFANNIELLTYPNPVEDILFIKGHQSLYDIKIYDILGKEVFNDIVDESVDLTSLNKGLFFVKISDSNGGNLLKKIIKL